jgi:hypothetical protein
MSNQADREEALFLCFILPQRRARYLAILASPKRRDDITRSLAHFPHLDMRYAVATPPSQHHARDIFNILKSKGAPDICYVMSENIDLDGKEMSVEKVLKKIVGCGIGTFVSCIKGKLGYFEDEDHRWILEKKTDRKVRQ